MLVCEVVPLVVIDVDGEDVCVVLLVGVVVEDDVGLEVLLEVIVDVGLLVIVVIVQLSLKDPSMCRSIA